MYHIVVCVKQVYDPEAPVSLFDVDEEAKTIIPPKGSPPVLNPYDENALEAALKIKDELDAKITVFSMGRKLAKPVLIKNLAVGADELFMIQDDTFDGLDAYPTAVTLSKAIQENAPDFNLIICGRQAADTNAGLVGPMLADILEIHCVPLVRSIKIDNDRVSLEKEILNGNEKVDAPLPCLVTVGSEMGELRMAPVKALMAARKKKAPVITADDLDVDIPGLKQIETLVLKKAPGRGGDCQMIEADTPQIAGELLAERLKQDNII